MKIEFTLFRQFFVVISLFVLVISCNNEPKVADVSKNQELTFCKIITSSSDNPYYLLDTNIWKSSNIGKDDVLIFIFYSPVFVQKIDMKQIFAADFDEVKAVEVYTNNGIIGEFAPENININQKVGFVALKISKTDGFNLTNAYKDSTKFQIAFENLNKPIALKKIDFWENDSVLISLVLIRKHIEESSFGTNFLNKKRIDYSNSEYSLVFKSSGEFLGSSNDTIYYGTWSKKNWNTLDLTIKKFIFSDENYSTKEEKTNLKIEKNIVIIRDLPKFMSDFEDDYLVDISTYDSTIVQDIRYATDNNFMGKVIYDCPFCLFRYGAAKDLISAQKEFQKMGYSIKVFDCYRPLRAQYKLWEVMPNINYVANPEKGSIHNRGAAVDLTLVDSLGNELDMGTEFDYFGYKAFSINMDLPDTILHNRQLLWSVMKKNGFMTIKTEWWHMSHYSCLKYQISDVPFPCE